MSDTFDQFTESARRVLTLAQEEARWLGHNYIGTEHLLLGLVREGDGIAARVLGNLGVQLPKVRSAVEHIIGRGAAMVMGGIGLTPRTKKVIELAVDEARRLNHRYVGTEHLLLGLVREGEGIAAGVLGSMGVDLEQTRAQALQIIQAPGGVGAGASVIPVMSPSPRSPELRDLIRVYPIGQTARRGAVEVLALALEVYATGFIVTLQIQSAGRVAGGPGGASAFGRGTPDLPLVASDDRGGRYTSVMHGGNGGGGPESWQWRTARAFSPALDPAARELRLEAATVDLPRADPSQGRPAPSGSFPGPWSFTVALSPTGDGGAGR